MSELQKNSMDSASPSIQGRGEMSLGCDDERFISPKECCKATYGSGSSSFNWVTLLKILITVLTALAGALGLSACAGW